MADILKRLCARALDLGPGGISSALISEAADEIATLRARVTALTAERDAWLAAAVDQQSQRKKSEARVTALTAERDGLREAARALLGCADEVKARSAAGVMAALWPKTDKQLREEATSAMERLRALSHQPQEGGNG